jgi:GTP-binding protein HflX
LAKTIKNTISTAPEKEKAMLVAVDSGPKKGAWPVNESLDELEQLALTAGATIVGRLSQQTQNPSKNYYLGKGKLEELKELKEDLGYNLLIFDDELSALQQRNLEDELGVKIIDRVALIIDIFARHARSREGMLQVSLAQSEYLLPRLAGQWSHLERLGGGIGTRGPGETQIETDRRLAQKKISRLKQQIEDIKKQRKLHQKSRQQSEIPTLALVGYTNTGKSTLLNALSHASILAEDKLFATLDPTTRRVHLPDNMFALISDTVGFIRKLPPGLVSAFRATLEELNQADILLHVVDFSNPRAAEQCDTVENILEDMEISIKPRITVLNKIDRALDPSKTWTEKDAIEFIEETIGDTRPNTVIVSAARGWGMEKLKETISSAVTDLRRPTDNS